MVVVEQVVEAKEQEKSCIKASTPNEVCSTEVVAKRENETSEQLVEYDIEEDTTKDRVWMRKDEQGDPKKAWKWLDWHFNKFGMSLAFPIGNGLSHLSFEIFHLICKLVFKE